MKVIELIAQLQKLPPDLLVKVLTDDGNGYYHGDPELTVLQSYTESYCDLNRYKYTEVHTPILQIAG